MLAESSIPSCNSAKGGRSANKFRKSQTANLRTKICSRFADLPQMWQFADLRYYEPFIFCGLKNFRKYIIFILTKISLKCSRSNLRATFVFWDTHMAFRSLKYSYVGKENIRQTNADLDQKHYFFPYKFEDLQLRTGTPLTPCYNIIPEKRIRYWVVGRWRPCCKFLGVPLIAPWRRGREVSRSKENMCCIEHNKVFAS